MPLGQIFEEEMHRILQRAQEIAQYRPAEREDDIEAFLKVAEEVGIPREATRQALRERHLLANHSLTTGDLVFAASADQNLYAASVISVNGASVVVRFVTGGEQTCTLNDVQPVSFTPGYRLQYRAPGMSWISAKVSRYDAVTRTIWLTSWLETQERETPLSQVRLTTRRARLDDAVQALLWRVALACGVGGVILGMLLERLFH